MPSSLRPRMQCTGGAAAAGAEPRRPGGGAGGRGGAPPQPGGPPAPPLAAGRGPAGRRRATSAASTESLNKSVEIAAGWSSPLGRALAAEQNSTNVNGEGADQRAGQERASSPKWPRTPGGRRAGGGGRRGGRRRGGARAPAGPVTAPLALRHRHARSMASRSPNSEFVDAGAVRRGAGEGRARPTGPPFPGLTDLIGETQQTRSHVGRLQGPHSEISDFHQVFLKEFGFEGNTWTVWARAAAAFHHQGRRTTQGRPAGGGSGRAIPPSRKQQPAAGSSRHGHPTHPHAGRPAPAGRWWARPARRAGAGRGPGAALPSPLLQRAFSPQGVYEQQDAQTHAAPNSGSTSAR
ncbi:Protein of unknown function [Gryllus bimaculatus]|nr:Protein of unknown function [Gryllus bimaculatus]